jgi:hypothetical protein
MRSIYLIASRLSRNGFALNSSSDILYVLVCGMSFFVLTGMRASSCHSFFEARSNWRADSVGVFNQYKTLLGFKPD